MRNGHSKIFQRDIIEVLDKQLLEGMGVLLTEEEQQKCEENVRVYVLYSDQNIGCTFFDHFFFFLFCLCNIDFY